MQNPASLQGWVKSTDPKTGRVFYANHITRKTQWDAPDGWVDVVVEAPNSNKPESSSSDDGDAEPLPANWEVMHDPTTGKPFYVDHERKITTWVRPKRETTSSSGMMAATNALKPAVASPPHSGNYNNSSGGDNSRTSSTMQRLLQQQQQSYNSHSSSVGRTYQQEVAYYMQPNSSADVDFSDALPPLDFHVRKVADALRPTCPGCKATFSMSKRRHHCRLCGDVFCDACSNHRCNLPLEGPEFDKPVRVCDTCFQDVDAGNFFSMRRYVTPLHLYPSTVLESEESGGVATAQNVNAALSAITADLEQMLQSGNPEMDTKVTIPPETLIPVLCKHLPDRATSDRAVRAIAAVLALENLAGQEKYATGLYLYGKKPALDNILAVLERSGSDRKTLFVQEQAARILFYLTESKIVNAVIQQQSSSSSDKEKATGAVEDLELHRAITSMVDHSANNKNPNLQRWSAATAKHLVEQDQRRACLAVNDAAARVASGEPPSSSLEYTSFLDSLVSTGGVMMLCSLIAAEDADTRAHAVGALGAILTSTRAIDGAMSALSEMTAGTAGRTTTKDGEIVRAIVAGGGCGSAVSQLICSADHGVASMGVCLIASLVMPLITDRAASATLAAAVEYDYRADASGMGACREASIEIATGSCLPALLSLVREAPGGTSSRPLELRKLGMETLAATVLSIGDMGKVWAQGQYEEGLERSHAPAKLKQAVMTLNEEGVMDSALTVLQASASQSLGSARETPNSRIREAAGLVLGCLTSCSAEAIMELQSRNILGSLLLNSNDASMTVPSTLRADGAPRCLGVLETVSSILMFAWQHPSGAASELLDRLMEVMDAGVIPYLSKVLNAKIEWDSTEKAVGGMKARAAACRLLCCVFGIALTSDDAASDLGMRRLMDAVATDARSYRGGDRTPSNIIEAALSTLQTAANHARKLLVGQVQQPQGPGGASAAHYQAALTDLVHSSLLAAGSMCGSSIAPGGGSEEGTMITARSFLESRNDQYVARRKEICAVACDVVVRGGGARAGGPALLPTMLVGGYGTECIQSSLRLAVSIGQNGSPAEHAKLATSGIMVPVSDLLSQALSKGELYNFSAALALLRCCGPHVATGQSGGLESVRGAIRVATSVLTLPINPGATYEQIKAQESLKSECIAALEALSKNAALWSSISKEALPSIVRYLHNSVSAASSGKSENDEIRQKTRCGALRAVLQIVQVPSHAVAAAEAGLTEPLGKLLEGWDPAMGTSAEDDMPMLSLEVIHVIAANQQARFKARFLDTGLVRSICAALGKSATEFPKKPSDSRADVTFLGLEILNHVLADIEGDCPFQQVLQKPQSLAFVDSLASEPRFVRSLAATLLLKTNMKLTRHDSESNEEAFDIPKTYGPPLILVPEKCAGHENTHAAAAVLLFTAAVYACAIDSQRSDAFWKTLLLLDLKSVHSTERYQASATLCAHWLSLLTADDAPFVPSHGSKQQDYLTLTRPLVRHRLLEALKSAMDEISGESNYGPRADPYVTSVLVGFNVPHICLSVWRDPALLDLAFDLIKHIVEQDPDEVLHLFVEGRAAIMSLFDLLNLDDTIETSKNVGEIRRFLASILGQLAESGLLADAVAKYDVRSGAISALASACLSEEERHPDEDEDTTSNKLSTTLMRCLVELCSVRKQGSGVKIQLSSTEAAALAKNLGKKVCHMVLSRFLERAKLQQYEIDDDENIADAPDVAMLCAIAQHEEALLTLRSIGGLHALSLVAAEGEISALTALKTACNANADVLLEGDTFAAMMNLVSGSGSGISWKDEATRSELESAAFELLARLASGSKKGRNVVAAAGKCQQCLERAATIVSALNPPLESSSNGGEPQSDPEEDGDSPAEKEQVAIAPMPRARPATDEVAVAACSFLAALAPTQLGRSQLLRKEGLVKSLAYLSESAPAVELKYAAVQVLCALTPHVTLCGPLVAGELADVFDFVLASEEKISSTPTFNANRLYYAAVSGLLVIFDLLDAENQKKLAITAANQFMKGVKKCVVTRSATTDEERACAANLAYNLTVVLILSRGKHFVDDVFSSDLLTSMLQLLQWRQDPKTTIAPSDLQSWDGTISNCLLILSTILWRPDEVLDKAGIQMQSLGSTTLMLARPGKAPRRAIDVKTALERTSEGTDASAAMAAQCLLERLY